MRKSFQAIGALLLIFSGTEAHPESHAYLTRELGGRWERAGLELVCLDKPKLCRVSRTLGMEATEAKDVPLAEAERIFRDFARELKNAPYTPLKEKKPGRALTLDFAFGKEHRRARIPYASAVPAQLDLALMHFEARLSEALR